MVLKIASLLSMLKTKHCKMILQGATNLKFDAALKGTSPQKLTLSLWKYWFSWKATNKEIHLIAAL
jgi:hypothetical protein